VSLRLEGELGLFDRGGGRNQTTRQSFLLGQEPAQEGGGQIEETTGTKGKSHGVVGFPEVVDYVRRAID
jgi:hypothetical protein